MKYWWVNQNQTFDQEYAGGYMWSPKTKKDGARNQFYDNMTRVSQGDIIFSFKATLIQAIGIVRSQGYTSPKPHEFGKAGDAWGGLGWKVDVAYSALNNKISPKAHIEQLRSTLPDKYSPLQTNGNGNQAVYLAEVPDRMASVLLKLIGREAKTVLGNVSTEVITADEIRYLEEDRIEKEIVGNTNIQQTEKEAIVKSRRGQGVFRSGALAIEKCCRITGVSNPNHLIASHIKPWGKCDTNIERLDGNNGLLLSPNVDHLFDRGYISFEDDGILIVSPEADLRALHQMGIEIDESVNVGRFNKFQKKYLQYHRENIFRA